MLFDNKLRTRTEPKRRGETEFSFYDSTARPEFAFYRYLLNNWLAELPASERKEMVARMQKSGTLGYQAALAELTLHAALVRQSFKVDIHPKAGHPTRRPDFLVRDVDGVAIAFVEVTTFGPSQDDVARENREASIYNALDRLKIPAGFGLGYDVVTYGKKSPNLRRLCLDVQEWVASSASEALLGVPRRLFEADDWKIELRLYRALSRTADSTRAIAVTMGDVRVVDPRVRIREALEKKGSRYHELGAPYVIAIADCRDELIGGDRNNEALNEAVFGSIRIQHSVYDDGSTASAEVRAADGYWVNSLGPIHRNVSAAILLPKPHMWSLRDPRWQPIIVRNPWATYPLAHSFMPLPGHSVNAETGEYVPIDGTPLADLLALPTVWPPEFE